jgi:U3 small nucleolar RNA-associated protein 10
LFYFSLRELYASDDEYLSYNQDILLPTLSSLCLAVQKELLWKPMNYQILLLTRHSLTVVRRSAIQIIGKLFQEIGDDFLHLLPECIQFISELLEDSHSDVIAATRETINIIEDLSGEKLDTFLAH